MVSVMELILKPFAVVFLTIRKGVNAFTLTLTFHVLAFVGIAVLEQSRAFSVGFSCLQLSFILCAIMRDT